MTMNIYRLNPIDPGHASWSLSNEKDVVWACAPSPESARALVAAKTRVEPPHEDQHQSPWENQNVTSCDLDPSMSLLHPGAVVRQDGSAVDT
jgi:hypothetical protein